MTNDDKPAAGDSQQQAEALQALAGYPERSLDRACSVIMMRHTADVCTVYLGDPESTRAELRQIGAISIPLANEMLASTSSGANLLQIGDQHYRFTRIFGQVDGVAAVVFAAL